MVWEASDGTPLHVRHWTTTGTAWATVLIVHGIAEHSGRYDRTGRLLARVGLDVNSFDLRGHGLSGGRRVFVGRWDDYLDDLEIVILHLRATSLPLVVIGHSMGALIALTYACSGRPRPDLLVLSAPPLAARIPAWQRVAAPVLSRVAPERAIDNPISGDQLSRNPKVAKAYFADPLVVRHTTTRLGNELLASMRRVRKQLSELTVPTLVLHGEADTLVPTTASEPLAAISGVERRVLPALRHEILNEPEGPEVVGAIVRWVRDNLRAGSSKSPAHEVEP
jgi:alpha-beta hydrolase superfamily lysophospholipase